MTYKSLLAIVVLLSGAACSTENLTPQLESLSGVTDRTATDLNRRLASAFAAEDDERLRRAIANDDIFTLSDDCPAVVNNRPTLASGRCAIAQETVGDREPYIGPATGASRQMAVLRTYIASIDGLASATSEADAKAHVATALGILNDVGSATEAEGILEFVKKRKAESEKTGAVIDAAVATYRYRKLKDVVLSSNAAVQTLTREIQLQLLNTGLYPDYLQRARRLRDAEDRVLLLYDGDPAEQFAAIRALEREIAAFQTYNEGTAIHALAKIAEGHDALVATLRAPQSPEDYVNFLKSLKELSDILGA